MSRLADPTDYKQQLLHTHARTYACTYTRISQLIARVAQLVIDFLQSFQATLEYLALLIGILVEALIQELYPQLIRVSSSEELKSSFNPYVNYFRKIFLGSEKRQNFSLTISKLLFGKEDPEQRVQIALAPRPRPLLAAHIVCC